MILLNMDKRLIAFCTLITGLVTVNNQVFAQQHNLALKKTVQVSSEDSAHPAKNITDGKISRNSKWQASSGKTPHVIEIDLQKYANVTEIIVHSGILDQEKKSDEMVQAAGFWSVKNFKLQYWDDANWSDFPKAEVHENRLIAAGFKFSPAITTYKIRLICDDGEPINIMEIEVLGTITPNMPAPPTVMQVLSKSNVNKGDQKATIKVSNKIVGKTMKFVGYNQGYYFPGSNVSGWIEYSNVNSLRVWTSLNAFVPEQSVQVDSNVTNVAEFDKRKQELRASPEGNKFLKWAELNPLYDVPDSSSTNAMVYNYALSELKRLGIAVVLQIGSTDFNDTWANKWKQWQRYYAIAYHSARKGDVAMYAMQNEPNHRHSGPMLLDQWIAGAKVASDAIHCAVNDVNKQYHKNLQPKFVGPVTAGHNTDWWAAIAKSNRVDYHGEVVDNDIVDLFSTHSYNSPAAGYEHRIQNISKILSDNHPKGNKLPILYTEIGRWMNAYLIDKEETMDSPSLFTEWAGIYSNNMKNGGYGMWAFKFANTASSTYPRGIKSGHHYIWQGQRIVEDAHVNIAANKPVKTSSATNKASLITDGYKNDESAWVSENEAEKWIEIDLGSVKEIGGAVVYTGSAAGVYTSPDRIKNFSLQYLVNNNWVDISGAKEKDGRYAQVFYTFKQPVSTNKIRFISGDKGVLKVREIKLFAKGDVPSTAQNFNVSGIQRTGEVVRLFAKGFKEERNLLQTESSVKDSDLDTYTSFDEKTGNYYIWLVQRGLGAYQLNLDLSQLNIKKGVPITAELVNDKYYGEVVKLYTADASKRIAVNLPAQSVMLLTVSSVVKNKIAVIAKDNVTVKGGKLSNQSFSSDRQLAVQLDAANSTNNKVSYIYFDVSKSQLGNLKKAVLEVNGKADKGAQPYRLHVYAIPTSKALNANTTWNNALLLDRKEALIQKVGSEAFVAGQIAFNLQQTSHYLDVTDILKKHVKTGVQFVFVRETRQLGDDEDKGRQVLMNTIKTKEKPTLHLWQ